MLIFKIHHIKHNLKGPLQINKWNKLMQLSLLQILLLRQSMWKRTELIRSQLFLRLISPNFKQLSGSQMWSVMSMRSLPMSKISQTNMLVSDLSLLLLAQLSRLLNALSIAMREDLQLCHKEEILVLSADLYHSMMKSWSAPKRWTKLLASTNHKEYLHVKLDAF